MLARITIGNVEIGPDRPLVIIAGPCVLESADTNRRIADHLKTIDYMGFSSMFLEF